MLSTTSAWLADRRAVTPGQIFIPDKHALPWLVKGGTSESCLDCTPNRPGVAEKEVLGELDPRQHLPVPQLLLASNFLPRNTTKLRRIPKGAMAGTSIYRTVILSSGSEPSKEVYQDCTVVGCPGGLDLTKELWRATRRMLPMEYTLCVPARRRDCQGALLRPESIIAL